MRERASKRERADHGYWLLIYHISPHHSRTPINIQGLEARGVDRGQAMCKRREHKDKTPRFIYAAWRFVTTLWDKCLLEARGISSVIMENINWFCNDFHLCSPDLLCISKKAILIYDGTQLIGIEKKQSNEMMRSFISYSLVKVICTGQWAKVFFVPVWNFLLDWVRRRMMEKVFFLTPCGLKRDIPCCLLVCQQRPPGKASSNITCPNTEGSASWLVCCYRNMLLACQQVSY